MRRRSISGPDLPHTGSVAGGGTAAIYACAVDNPQTYALRVGTITQRAAFSPRRQSWRRSALQWVDTLAAVPATEKG